MDNNDIFEDDYLTDGSSGSFYEVQVDLQGAGKKPMTEDEVGIEFPVMKQAPPLNPISLESLRTQSPSSIGTQFQEFLMRAFMQSTAALIGPPPGQLPAVEGGSTASPVLCTQGLLPISTCSEGAFNKVEARRRRKPHMLRTSAGEDSDSQADFPIPENESLQQKSLRARRLNRSRLRRAEELTNNRKALNKLPNVIHVDGAGKAKGIHKHQWRAAVRGQCGRLDPSKENMKRQSKHIVDSIWHALQKEWEFEGFAHRAREMFERSATKCMRNRKMHLKYKWQKSVEGHKPDDVSGVHWAKIADIVKKSANQATSNGSKQSILKGKERIPGEAEEDRESPLQLLGSGSQTVNISPNCRSRSECVLLEEDDVDSKIRSLQRELLRLQNSKKVGFNVEEDVATVNSNVFGKEVLDNASRRVLEGMKENIMPHNDCALMFGEASSKMPLKIMETDLQGNAVHGGDKKKKQVVMDVLREFQEEELAADKSKNQRLVEQEKR